MMMVKKRKERGTYSIFDSAKKIMITERKDSRKKMDRTTFSTTYVSRIKPERERNIE